MRKSLFFSIFIVQMIVKGNSEYQDFKRFDDLHGKINSSSFRKKRAALGKSMENIKKIAKNPDHLKKIEQDCNLRSDCKEALQFKRAFYEFVESEDEFIRETSKEAKESAECAEAMVKKYRPHFSKEQILMNENNQEKYQHLSEYDSYRNWAQEFRIFSSAITQSPSLPQIHNKLKTINCENECDNSPEFKEMFYRFIDALEKKTASSAKKAYDSYVEGMVDFYLGKAEAEIEAFKKQEKEFYALLAQESESYEDYQKFEQIRKEFIEKEKYIKSMYGDMMLYKKDHPQWTFNVSMLGGDSDIR